MTGTPQIMEIQRLSLALTPDDHVKLKILCDRDGNRTKSSLIRTWIRERTRALKEEESPTTGPKTTPTGD